MSMNLRTAQGSAEGGAAGLEAALWGRADDRMGPGTTGQE